MFMQEIDINMVNGLKDQVLNLSAKANTDSNELSTTIVNAQETLQQALILIQNVSNNMLVDFVLANIMILDQLRQVVAQAEIDNKLLVKTSNSIKQLANAYQEAIVPILTRLHNLSENPDDIQKITAITALGNEIITCSSQINQFSDNFNATERIYTIFGIAMMLSSISMLIAILSKKSIHMNSLIPPSLLALGYNLCKKAMLAHVEDISTDLIFTSVKKIEPLIYEVAKHDPEIQELLTNILNQDSNTQNTVELNQPSAENKEHKTDANVITNILAPVDAQETLHTENVSLGQKIKNIFDRFNTKK